MTRARVLEGFLAGLVGGMATLGCAASGPTELRPLVSSVLDSEVRGWGQLDGEHGVALFYQYWRPAGPPRGTIVITHGLEDHGTRYARFAGALTAAGYAVYAYDLRGHGRSAGARVAVGEFDDYVRDLERFARFVVTREQGGPLFVMGHSLGGAITAVLATSTELPLRGVILSAPALALDLRPETIGATRWLGAALPDLPALDLPNEDFSRDPAVVRAMSEDELIHQRPGPAHTAAELAAGIARFWRQRERLRAPVLLLHGTRDRLTSPRGSKLLGMHAGTTQVTLRVYPGLYHDLLHEPEHAQVSTDIITWLDGVLAGGSPSPAWPETANEIRVERARRAGDLRVGLGYEHRVSDDASDAPALVTGLALGFRGERGPWAHAFEGHVGGSDEGFAFSAELFPLGIGLGSAAHHVALLAGGGGGRLGGSVPLAWQFPVRLVMELQVATVRLTAWGQLAWTAGNDRRQAAETSLGFGDDLAAGLGLAFGRNVPYWPGATAGGGPELAAVLRQQGGLDFFGIQLALRFWGTD